MKKLFTSILSTIVLFVFSSTAAKAQCATAKINWDNLDFLVLSGSYTPYVSSALVQNQHFALGKNRMTFVHNYNPSTSLSENNTHTGETGTFGIGADVQFAGNGAITFNFDAPVQNLQFSLYDIDYTQRAAFSAFNGGSPVNVNLATLAGTILTITNNNSTTARVDAAASVAAANTSTDAAVNVTVAGQVTSITITLSNTGTKTNGQPSGQEDGSFWVSDIAACVTGAFPSNYYMVSSPFTGQPAYVLTVVDNNVYYTNPANGVSKFLFTDPGHTNINSLAYDPVNRIVYYAYSLTATPQNERTIRKYDVNTATLSVLNSDVYSNLNIPTYEEGITSGAAAFYDGALYLGVEGYNSGSATGRKSLIWRIDFDGSLNATQSSQVYGSNADLGTNTIHDWSDVGISNGILYDFDGAATDDDIYHYNLQTGDSTHFVPTVLPRQVAVDWTGQVYNVSNTIAAYNYNGANGTAYTITSTPAIPVAGSWGDAAEAFRPLMDFGDAPASYDPDPLSPAVNDKDTALRIGGTLDMEWLKTSSALANADGTDEDGLAFVPILSPGAGSYLTQVSVYNNKGVPATLVAWLDYNGNGIFDASEAITPVAVPSSTSSQLVNLFWPVTTNSFSSGQSTYLRIRLTTGSLTTADATGYYDNGETEDYTVTVDNFPLSVNLLSFDAKVVNKISAELSWKTSGEENFTGFELQRSRDNSNWNTIGTIAAKGNGQKLINDYFFNDFKPLAGKSFYRLKLVSGDGKYKNSEVRTIIIKKGIEQITLSPNPAADKTVLSVTLSIDAPVSILITDISGKMVHSQTAFLRKGINTIDLPVIKRLGSGMYFVRVTVNDESFTKKLIIKGN